MDTFSLPVSLEHCNRGRPHSYSTSPHQVCRFSFVACRDVHHLLFPIFEWMDHLVVDDACYIIHALFSDCLLVSSWCLVSSRSKGDIAFECSESAVRTVRARQYLTFFFFFFLTKMSPLASRLYVFSNDDDDDDNFIAIYMYITRHTCNGMRFAPELLHIVCCLQYNISTHITLNVNIIIVN